MSRPLTTSPRILVIHGPNLNLLGRREPEIYGRTTLNEINHIMSELGEQLGLAVDAFQSNHEGFIIDFIQNQECEGIIINPGALCRYGYSLRAALIDKGVPVVEVHLSDVDKTGTNKKTNVIRDIAIKTITGKKEQGYLLAVEELCGLK